VLFYYFSFLSSLDGISSYSIISSGNIFSALSGVTGYIYFPKGF